MSNSQPASAEERILDEWYEHDAFKRIDSLESFALAHHWKEYKGKETVPEFLKRILASYRQEVEREAVKRFIKECRSATLPKRKNPTEYYEISNIGLDQVFDKLYPSK